MRPVSAPPLWSGWTTDDLLTLPHYDLFWARVDIIDDDSSCWQWGGATDKNGYGVLVHRGRHWRANRAAWTLTHGPIPNGLDILHSCDWPPCCRPAWRGYKSHLRPGTEADNAADRIARNRDAIRWHERLRERGQGTLPLDLPPLDLERGTR